MSVVRVERVEWASKGVVTNKGGNRPASRCVYSCVDVCFEIRVLGE